jgi:DNA polymerase I
MKKIYLIDGNSFIYRMFFALPDFATSSWKLVGAIFGMAKFFMEQLVSENPDYVIFVRDAKGDNFRHELYSEYKATRERMPDSLREQLADIDGMIRAMNIDIIETPGFEADDVIATLATELWKDSQNQIYILSGDKDLYALIRDNVQVYDTQKKRIFGREETIEKFGVPPECVRDYLAICGDTSDNIPGISWIGPKKAEVFLGEFKTLENLYDAVEKISENQESLSKYSQESQKLLKWKTLENLVQWREFALLSQKLATLCTTVPLQWFQLSDYHFSESRISTPEVREIFEKFEFSSLLKWEKKEKKSWKDMWLQVQIIGDTEWLKELEQALVFVSEIVLDTETTSINVQEAELVGVSLYIDDQNIYYINRWHTGAKVEDVLLRPFLESILQSDRLIIGHNLKYDLEILELYIKSKTPTGIKKPQKSLF